MVPCAEGYQQPHFPPSPPLWSVPCADLQQPHTPRSIPSRLVHRAEDYLQQPHTPRSIPSRLVPCAEGYQQPHFPPSWLHQFPVLPHLQMVF